MVKGYKGIRWTWLVAIVWALVVIAVSINYRSNVASMQTLEKMADNVEELQSILAYDAPFRTKHLDKVGVIIQRIYIQRVKLESELSSGFINPDINQTLYTIDRYIEHIRSYIRAETDIVSLVNNLRATREKYIRQDQLESVYFQLSAYVLEALYSDSSGSPAVYRALDKVFLLSQSLSSEQARELQQLLGQISAVLGGYAQSSYLIEKLLNNSIHEQISYLEHEYHHYLDVYLVIIIVLSGVCIFVLSLSRVRNAEAIQNQEMQEPQVLATAGAEVPEVVPVEQTFHAEPEENISENIVPEVKSKVVNQAVKPKVEEPPTLIIDFAKLTDSLSGDTESVALLLNVFIQDHQEDVQVLESLLGEDHEKALRKAHSLKGVAANIGAAGLREAANEIEKALKENAPVTSQMLQELQAQLEQAIGAAQEYLQGV